jgi:hypothetical protein
VVGLLLGVEGLGRRGPMEGLLVPGWYTLPLIALVATPIAWWRIACRGPHAGRQGALAGAILGGIFSLAPTTYVVTSIAFHGPGDLTGLVAVWMVFLAWVVALPVGAALGAVGGLALRPPGGHAATFDREQGGAAPPGRSSSSGDNTRSGWRRWLDQGERRPFLRVAALLLALPLILLLSIGFIAIQWKRAEVRVEDARVTSPNGTWVAASYSYSYRWTQAHHRFDVRLCRAGAPPVRGSLFWESEKVPVTSLRWSGNDSVVVSATIHNDEYVAWLKSTIKAHTAHDVVGRTDITLDPPFLMVSNPSKPDDLALDNDDIQLSKDPVFAGDSTMIRATVHNLGLRPAIGVRVDFDDDRLGDAIGKRTIDIVAGGATTIEMPWQPALPDTHVIAVRVSPFSFPSEESYTNNYAELRLVLGQSWRRDSMRGNP